MMRRRAISKKPLRSQDACMQPLPGAWGTPQLSFQNKVPGLSPVRLALGVGTCLAQSWGPGGVVQGLWCPDRVSCGAADPTQRALALTRPSALCRRLTLLPGSGRHWRPGRRRSLGPETTCGSVCSAGHGASVSRVHFPVARALEQVSAGLSAFPP